MADDKEPATTKRVRVTIDLPEDLHEAFSRKCFLSRPRLRMNAVIVGLVKDWTAGKPVDGGGGKSKSRSA